MALIKCHECSGQISDHARTCPHCGAPVIATIKRRQKQAVKLMLIQLVLAVAFGLTAWVVLHHIFNKALAPLQNLQH